MVLLIFRLSKYTGTNATFTLGKTLDIEKLVFKGFTKEHADNLAADADGLAPGTNSDLPIILASTLFLGDNRVCFYQGQNATINAGGETDIGNMIPLGGTRENREQPFRKMDLTIIDHRTTFAATTEISFSLLQIHNNVLTSLTSAQAFGSVVDDNSTASSRVPIDHGINLYFEATTTNAHNINQTFSIANAEGDGLGDP